MTTRLFESNLKLEQEKLNLHDRYIVATKKCIVYYGISYTNNSIKIMRGKVKNIKRSEWYVGNLAYQHSHDFHDIRMTCLYAETYEGYKVIILESEVLTYYGRTRFSDKLIDELNNALHNRYIDFEANEEGEYILSKSLSSYLDAIN